MAWGRGSPSATLTSPCPLLYSPFRQIPLSLSTSSSRFMTLRTLSTTFTASCAPYIRISREARSTRLRPSSSPRASPWPVSRVISRKWNLNILKLFSSRSHKAQSNASRGLPARAIVFGVKGQVQTCDLENEG